MDEDSNNGLLQLCDEYLSKHLLSAEILQYDKFDDVAIDTVVICLHLEAKQKNILFQDIATKFVCESIEFLVTNQDENSRFTPKFLMALMSKLSMINSLKHYEIQQQITSFPSLLPPQLVVKLDQLGIVSFASYFQNGINSSKKVASWVKCMLQLACEPEEEDDTTTLQALVTSVIGIGFSKLPPEMQSSITGQTVKTSVLMINSITRKTWDFLWENPEIKVPVFDIPQGFHSLSCSVEAVQSCYLEQLAFLLSYKPDIKASAAIASQHEWTYFKCQENITNFIMQLLLPLNVEKLLEKIADVLIRYEVNWKTMLLVVSTLQVCFVNGNKLVKAMVSDMIHKGVETMQIELVLASILLARQISAEATNTAIYGAWFASIVPSSVNTKQFTFLMKFLSNIVRHEPLWVLVAHRNHPPNVPSMDNCRTLWSDYIALVRTRIEDLKLQTPAEKIIEEDQTVVKEVEAAIASFEKSGRIPTSVIEAAIFRKPYFTGKFLPVLLKPRNIPAPIDVREEFIDELRRSGKLPLNQYETYASACKELEKHAQDVQMDWKTSDGSPNFRALMDRIADYATKESGKVTQLIDKLSEVLNELLPKAETLIPLIELSPDMAEADRKENNIAWSIVDSWFSSIEKTLKGSGSIECLPRYLHVLCPHASVTKALYLLVYQNFVQVKQKEKVRCIARVLCLLNFNSHLLIPVRYESFQGEFIRLLFSPKSSLLTKSDSMLFAVEVLHHAVADAKALEAPDSAPQILSAFVWLSRRLSYSRKFNECYEFTKLAFDPEVARNVKMTLKEWFSFEVNVKADEDVLKWAERSGYLRYILETYYANADQAELATSILEAIITRSTENTSGYVNCSSDLLVLLQSSIYSTEDSGAMEDAWLLKFWQSWHERKGKNIDQVIWSLACALPAHLFCRNSLKYPATDSSLRILTELTEESWRHSMVEGAWFPKHVTAHIIRASDDSRLIRALPCLQFSMQIHGIRHSLQTFGCWKTLEDSLQIFNPLNWRMKHYSTFTWSGHSDTDVLACQLMLLALIVEFERNVDGEWPSFVNLLSSSVLRDSSLLKGFKIASWTSDDYVLPWRKILPDNTMNLIALVILKVLISWCSAMRKADFQVAFEYLKAVFAAYSHWIQVSNSFIDTLSETADSSEHSYPAGKLLEFSTLGKLNQDVKQIIQEVPLRAVKSFQQLPEFRSLDSEFQTAIKQRNI